MWAASLPFYLLYFMCRGFMPLAVQIGVVTAITVGFLLVNIYDFVMYYLDTLIITNQRIVHLDWINPFKYMETQAMLDDIQNVESEENGFLSVMKIFDFGEFLVETASTRTVISFEQAPDPEAIKFFVTTLSRRHSSIEHARRSGQPVAIDKVTSNTENTNSKVVS